MDWTIRKLDSPPVIVATTIGHWDPARFEELVETLASEKLKDPSSSILIDDRALEFDTADVTEMDAVSEMFTSREQAFGGTKIALLMYSIDHFVAAFQFQSQTQAGITAEMKVFCDESAALDWLADRQSQRLQPI